MRIFAGANYPFIARRRTAYLVSAVVLAASLGSMAFHAAAGRGWLNHGIDFTGGVLVQVRFDSPRSTEAVRAALASTAAHGITRVGDASEFIVRASSRDATAGDQAAETIVARLAEAFPSDRIEVVRTEMVGPSVGAELQLNAAKAILISFALTLVYLAFRFEPRFGLAAVLATVHDVIVTLGILSLLRIEVGVATVASVLTVVGYSLNDTIVVFDRVREKLQGARAVADEADLVNRAVNETLPRTVLTSGTTIAVLLPLLLIGGVVLRDFAVVLMLGIVAGTYSSIYIAAPALLAIRRWGQARERRSAGGRPAAEKTPRPLGRPRGARV